MRRWLLAFWLWCCGYALGVMVVRVTNLADENSEVRTTAAVALEPGTPTTACAAWAGAWPPGGPGSGHEAIKPVEAIPICEAAVRADPADSDLKAHLCRALQAAGRDEEAFYWCRSAAAAMNPRGGLP
jgi:hypothetical protein